MPIQIESFDPVNYKIDQIQQVIHGCKISQYSLCLCKSFYNLEQTFAIFTHLLNIMSDILDKEIKYLKGVGPKRAEMLAKELGILTCRDILYYFPFKYIDRSRIYKINEIDTTQTFIQVKGKISHFRMEGQRHKQRLVGIFTDGTGTLELVWFKGIQWVMSNYQLKYRIYCFWPTGHFQ